MDIDLQEEKSSDANDKADNFNNRRNSVDDDLMTIMRKQWKKILGEENTENED